jgi:hypothetical protein
MVTAQLVRLEMRSLEALFPVPQRRECGLGSRESRLLSGTESLPDRQLNMLRLVSDLER